MTRRIMMVGLLLAAPLGVYAGGAVQGQRSAVARLPVREVTAFKDGHAVIVHEGRLPVDAAGRVVMDYLPTPFLGAFWPYVTDPTARLVSTTSANRRTAIPRSAITLREMMEANEGAEVTITEVDGKPYDARLVRFPRRSAAELEATGPPGTGDLLPEYGDLVLLEVAGKTKALPFVRVRDCSFKGKPREQLAREEMRHALTARVTGLPAGRRDAGVGLMYVQRGLRWIPGYRVTLDGKGVARIHLQATLVNDLVDLNAVSLNLVIGAPSFAFADTPDPIGLQQQMARVSQVQRGQRMNFAFSNAVMSQVPGMAGGGGLDAPVDPIPEVEGGQKAEDLFVFNLRGVSLRKGERMVLPVTEYQLPYLDVFVLDIPFSPPAEVWGNLNDEQQQQMRQLLATPKFVHRVRLQNSAAQPLTTAPALILRDRQVLAQGMMTYTAPGGKCDLSLNTAVDLRVRKEERETGRLPNAERYRGDSLQKVSLEGILRIENLRGNDVSIEVIRNVLGRVERADNDGGITQVNVLEDEGSPDLPRWWPWFNWPEWWHHRNGVGRIRWTKALPAGKSAEFRYAWHYFTP